MKNRFYEGKKFEKIFFQLCATNNDLMKIWRINDLYDSRNKLVKNNNMMHADFLILYNGLFMALELKETANVKYFNYYKINKLQKKFLSDVEKFGGVSLIIIYSSILDIVYWSKLNDINQIAKGGKIYFNNFKNYSKLDDKLIIKIKNSL